MPPRALDEARTEYEEPLGTEPDDGAQRRALPQYTLGGLFVFVTALAVSLSLAVSGARVIGRMPDVGLLLVGLATIVAWVVLFMAYRTLHATGALVVHCVGTAVATAFSFGPAYYAFPPIASGRAIVVFGLIGAGAIGCVLGSAFSLPVFVVTMIYSAVKGTRRTPIDGRVRK